MQVSLDMLKKLCGWCTDKGAFQLGDMAIPSCAVAACSVAVRGQSDAGEKGGPRKNE